jgi:diacylglycerol kinase
MLNNGSKYDLNKNFSLKARLTSFKDAFRGIATLFRYELNARIHVFILLIVIFAGIILRISATDWLAICLVSGLVLVSECFNTALEYLSDVVSPEKNEKIKRAKDVAAAGVLISAIIAVITGIIVFLPMIYKILIS